MSHKILVVTQSEFMRRVTSKTFILTTLLGPVLLGGFIAAMIAISVSTIEDSLNESFSTEPLRIGIADETGVLGTRIMEQGAGENTIVLIAPDSVEDAMINGEIDSYVHIPSEIITTNVQPVLHSMGGDRYGVRVTLSETIERSLKDFLLAQNNVAPDVRAILDRSVRVESVAYNEEREVREEAESDDAYLVLGGILGMLMYMGILIYGTLILYGAMEERTTRVVEVIVSSVRPFDLLMGKVLGIGLVGFAQMATWAVMLVGVTILAAPLIELFIDPAMYDLAADASTQELMAAADIPIPSISPAILIWFLLYFVGGYLLYGGLFAAVGTMVDSPQESQTLLLPLMMPIIISIVFMGTVIVDPHGSLAVGLSLFPLTSSVPMIVRIAIGGVPLWQILLSYGLLLGSFLASIWVSARIYRASLLMYGKKPSLKTVIGYLRTG
ncbi:MAG: ABC transporter permease [Rhodothermaceae bacterium]|nr:ABC transporter permease [Rhodothermaceae bacterium]MYG68598.1 ABC transporter permease [Rhodothermaceae bacterium]MYJ45238.1 ABC transporter permease [Rhodothermaceae bacterium]